jgi:hypothetical protein
MATMDPAVLEMAAQDLRESLDAKTHFERNQARRLELRRKARQSRQRARDDVRRSLGLKRTPYGWE